MLIGIRRFLNAAAPWVLAGFVAAGEVEEEREQALLAAVGREVLEDASLSNPPGMSCTSCHVPEAAFADPRAVSPGAVAGRVGRRNAPSLMYAALIPNMDQEDMLDEAGNQEWVWQGGMFQDGSARTLHER
jgi:cytochrome c peroxidase